MRSDTRSHTHMLVRRGRLERRPCEHDVGGGEVCGAPAQAHHPDYTKPWLVKWLCEEHHRALHRAEEEALRRQDDERLAQILGSLKSTSS